MDNKLLQLAFSVRSSPGAYACLVGSGISHAAGIPTGWEIVLGLIEELAAVYKEDMPDGPEPWYRMKFGQEPKYDTLIEMLAPAPVNRNSLLRKYFEPNEQEREQGLKQPTLAHRHIAWLVKRGYIRIILTTNFDHLLERALEEEGITPDICKTDDDFKTMPPLQHSAAILIKLHGDYHDWRIKNTEDELSSYSTELNEILARIFQEYGLIVCGWSANYDRALSAAAEVVGNPTRPSYGTYWAAYQGQLTQAAQRLVEIRQAHVIPISDGNHFFRELQEGVESLDNLAGKRSISTSVLVERAKKYLRAPEYMIDLEDLLRSEVEAAYKGFTGPEFQAQRDSLQDETAKWRLSYQAMERVLHVLVAIAWYGKEEHSPQITQAIERLFQAPSDKQQRHLMYRYIPGLLAIYAVGMIGVWRDKLAIVKAALMHPRAFNQQSQQYEPALCLANEELILYLYQGTNLYSNVLDSIVEHSLRSELEALFQNYFMSVDTFTHALDLFEMTSTLIYQQFRDGKDWAPSHKALFGRSREFLWDFWSTASVNSELLASDLFEDEVRGLVKRMEIYNQTIRTFHKRRFFSEVRDYLEAFKQSPLWATKGDGRVFVAG